MGKAEPAASCTIGDSRKRSRRNLPGAAKNAEVISKPKPRRGAKAEQRQPSACRNAAMLDRVHLRRSRLRTPKIPILLILQIL